VWESDNRDTANFIGDIMADDLCNLDADFEFGDSMENFLSGVNITGDCKWLQAVLGNKMSGNALESCFFVRA